MKRPAAVAIVTGSALLVCAGVSASSSRPVGLKAVSGPLAVVTRNSSPGPGLYRRDPNGGLHRLTASRTDGSPAWSGDGKRVAFTRGPSRSPRLYVMDRNGQGQHAVGRFLALTPSWGPGSLIVFAGKQGIWVVKADGTGLKRILRSGTAMAPAWSPSGKTILFSQGGRGLFAMRPGGGGVHVVIHPTQSAGHLYTLGSPAWSPDGKRIAFVQTDFLAPPGAGTTIVVANADGSGKRPLARIQTGGTLGGPTWSPDGGSIAFADVRGNKEGVFAVSAGGGTPNVLLGGNVWFSPSWGPPGA